MLDKTLPYYPMIMVREPDADCDYPCYSLPEGYAFRTYTDGMAEEWARLQMSVEHFTNIEDARQYFAKEFSTNEKKALMKEQCFFISNHMDELIATATLWYGSHFGRKLWRIHWVAVHPSCQGKGLAKALLTKLLDTYYSKGYTDMLYLTTQTWSYKAIKLYLAYGFQPYVGCRPVNFETDKSEEQFQKDNQKAWELVLGL